MSETRRGENSRKVAWLGLVIIVLLALAIVVAPVFIIQPFKAQTQRGIAVSYTMRSWSPYLTVAALIVAFILVGWLWRGARWFARVTLVIVLLPLLAVTWFARQNHFEWMFRPLQHSAYAKAGDASFVGDSDMVLAVNNNGESVAYPVRLMAYHHVVQDLVGGRPLVATY
jgi:Protein of unknown function (DUF3179)